MWYSQQRPTGESLHVVFFSVPPLMKNSRQSRTGTLQTEVLTVTVSSMLLKTLLLSLCPGPHLSPRRNCMWAETIGLIECIPWKVLGYGSLVHLIDDICLRGLCHVIFIALLFEKWCIIQSRFITWLEARNRKYPKALCTAGQPYIRLLTEKTEITCFCNYIFQYSSNNRETSLTFDSNRVSIWRWLISSISDCTSTQAQIPPAWFFRKRHNNEISLTKKMVIHEPVWVRGWDASVMTWEWLWGIFTPISCRRARPKLHTARISVWCIWKEPKHKKTFSAKKTQQ